MMIVVPMFIQTVTLGPIIHNLLNDNPVNAILFAGGSFMVAGVLAIRLNTSESNI